MRFDIVVNPNGASGRTGRIFRKLVPVMKESGREIHIHFSTKEKGIESIVRDLCRQQQERNLPILNLVIIGGDGTWNEAVNGVIDFDKVRLGYVPAGSGNDFAKALQLPSDQAVLLRRILTGKVRRRLDVGEVVFKDPVGKRKKEAGKKDENGGRKTVRRFNVSCGMGFDAAICHEAAISPLKGELNHLHLGKLVYILCAIKLIFTTDKYPVRVTQSDADMAADKRQEDGVCQNNSARKSGDGKGICHDTGRQHSQVVLSSKRKDVPPLVQRFITGDMRELVLPFGGSVPDRQRTERQPGKHDSIQEYASTLFALAMNTRYEGGGFAFCPKAVSDDGLLDVCIGTTRYNIMFFVSFPFIYSGSHTRIPVFRISQTKSVRFQSSVPLWVHTDGEVHYRASDIIIHLLPGKLQFLE